MKGFYNNLSVLKCIVCCVLSLLPYVTHAADKTELRGQRYCEIILSKSLRELAVYNTWGLNDCPQDIWKQITVAKVKKETGAHFVHLNGPRFWVIDGFQNTTLINPETPALAGLAVREAGILHLTWADIVKSRGPYTQHQIARNTTSVYNANKPVYELIDPKGNVYVMQSYSIQFAPQTEDSLANLEGKLTLPQGWHFKSGLITEQKTVKAILNVATVVQDDFFNTYQLTSRDLLG